MSQAKIGLDNPIFSGRFKQFGRGSYMPTQPRAVARQIISDIKLEQSQDVSSFEPVYIDQMVNSDDVSVKNSPIASKPSKPPVRRLSHSEVIQRNITAKPRTVKYRKPLISTQRIVLLMAVLVFLAGLGSAWVGFRSNRNVEAQVQSLTAEEEIPKEAKPTDSDIDSYKVAPDMPRVITIKRLGVKAKILNMGQDSKGSLMSPVNIFDTGWYNQSSKPGQAGAMLIDGHVHGPTEKGIFYGLKDLVAGDSIEVERGDGQKFSFKVVEKAVTAADKTDMAKAMLPIVDGQQGLNLITCTGQINTTTNEYPDRLVVYASRI